MKRTVVVLALIASAAAASAQSSVTLFGIVDAAVTHGRASGTGSAHRTQLTNSGYSTSRLGFRGVEDLGGGLSGGFWLEGQLINDDGTAGREIAPGNQGNTTARGQGFNFSRRSTVSLVGNWGEARLGRDFVPSNWNWGLFDPFGNVGVGASLILVGPTSGLNAGPAFRLQPVGQGTNGILVRGSNMISYFLPQKSGGFYGQVSYWFGENAQNGATNEDDGTGGGLRVGYQQGSFNVAAAWNRTTYRATPFSDTPGAPTGDLTSWNIGGDWNFGVGKLMGSYTRETRDSAVEAKGSGGQVGVLVPLGLHEIRAAYSTYRIDAGAGADPRARLLAAGYAYHFSKRTNMYATVARVRNSNGSRMALGGSSIGAGLGDARSTGFDLGVRHSF